MRKETRLRGTEKTDHSAIDESGVIRRAASGDRGAFEDLFHLYERRVMALAFRLTGDADLAADVTQEVFIRVYRNLTRFRQWNKFFTWIYRITVNASLDALKKVRRYREVPLDSAYGDRLQSTDTPDTGAAELSEAIWLLIKRLSAPQRTAFVLREADDLSCKEIAAMMGCTSATIRSHLSHARMRLRDEIKTKYPEFLNKRMT